MQEVTWAAGVLAYPRKPSTISATLQSLCKAGWPEYLLSIDSLKGTPDHRGPWKNFVHLLQMLLHKTSASHFVIVQDDAELATDLRFFLEETMPLRFGVMSPYCPSVQDDDKDGWLKNKRLPNEAYGALCYVMRRETASELLSFPHKEHALIDGAVGAYCKYAGLDYWIHRPSLVKHLGERSTLHEFGMTPYRQCKRFRPDARQQESIPCLLSSS